MKRLLFLFLILFLTISLKSQIDYRIETYLDSHNIDTFLVYEFECSGEILPGDVLSDSCQFDEPHYLFWKQNDSFFLKRFDYCRIFKTIALDTVNPLRYYLKNKKVIDKEEVKMPTYYETRRVKNKIEKVEVNSLVSHSCYHKFRLSREPEYKTANTYDLDFKEFDDGKRNVYYVYNQTTKFKRLIDLTTALLKEYEKKNQFETEQIYYFPVQKSSQLFSQLYPYFAAQCSQKLTGTYWVNFFPLFFFACCYLQSSLLLLTAVSIPTIL